MEEQKGFTDGFICRDAEEPTDSLFVMNRVKSLQTVSETILLLFRTLFFSFLSLSSSLTLQRSGQKTL